MLSVIMNADDSGPLADMAEDSGGMDTESPGLIPDDTQQLSDGELHDCVLPGHDSNTASPGCGMDTSVSSVQYGDQQEIAASRPAAPLIWEDSWSTGNARDDTQERLQDITGIKNAAPSVTSRDTVDDPAIKSAKRRMASDVPRESLHRDRPALAPLPSQSRLPILTVEGISLCAAAVHGDYYHSCPSCSTCFGIVLLVDCLTHTSTGCLISTPTVSQTARLPR